MSKRKDSLLGALGVIAALGNPGAAMDSFLTEWASFFQTAASIDPDDLSELQQTMSHYLSFRRIAGKSWNWSKRARKTRCSGSRSFSTHSRRSRSARLSGSGT